MFGATDPLDERSTEPESSAPKRARRRCRRRVRAKICGMGKRNPVMLVKTVVDKKSALQLSRRFAVRNHATTTNPARIPIKLT